MKGSSGSNATAIVAHMMVMNTHAPPSANDLKSMRATTVGHSR
jgi:hypothetical protein